MFSHRSLSQPFWISACSRKGGSVSYRGKWGHEASVSVVANVAATAWQRTNMLAARIFDRDTDTDVPVMRSVLCNWMWQGAMEGEAPMLSHGFMVSIAKVIAPPAAGATRK